MDRVIDKKISNEWWRLGSYLAGLLTLFAMLAHLHTMGQSARNDFSAFYCAGKTVLAHADPYRLHPLLDCEQAIRPGTNFVDPVPLPGYLFPVMAFLGHFSLRTAVLFYSAAIFWAIGIMAYALKKLAGIHQGFGIALCFFGFTYSSITLGQITPFAIAGLAMASLGLQQKKRLLTAIGVLLAMMQPQFGAPAALGIFVFVGYMRIPLILDAAILLLATIASVGLRGIVEYPAVLSMQAHAELTFLIQYSLSWLLAALGLPLTPALMLGTISTLISLAIGYWLLFRDRLDTEQPERFALIPVIFSLIGGTYVHKYQILAAAFAAVLLLAPRRSSPIAATALALLLLPTDILPLTIRHWPTLRSVGPLFGTFIALAIACDSLTSDHDRARKMRRVAMTCAGCAAYFSLLAKIRPIIPNEIPGFLVKSTLFASAQWQQAASVLGHRNIPTHFLLFEKLPTWCGMLLIAGILVRSNHEPARSDIMGVREFAEGPLSLNPRTK